MSTGRSVGPVGTVSMIWHLNARATAPQKVHGLEEGRVHDRVFCELIT